MMILQLAISLFLCSCCVYADTNNGDIGLSCSKPPPRGGGAKNDSWTANFYIVFNSIEKYVAISGFSKAEAGEGADKIYGLVQCRGDLSPSQCQDCTTDAFKHAIDRFDSYCDGSRDVAVWMYWCYVHYSKESFYGVWNGSGITTSYEADDPGVAAKGMEMMARLAAVAPNATNMFGAAEVDDGKGGKRYGLAQCSRDLDEFGCRECLEKSLKERSAFVGKTTRWQIAVRGCYMMYDASKLHFNNSDITISPPFSPSIAAPGALAPGLGRPKNAANRAWAGRLSKGMITTFAVAMGYLL